MFYQVNSAITYGFDIFKLRVEADISPGLPMLQMVGLLSTEAREAGDKIRSVLKMVGYGLPAQRIIINIAPGNIKKVGTLLDLPIAVSILGAMGNIDEDKTKDMLIVGEVSLSGDVLGVQGILPIVSSIRNSKIKKIMVPMDNYLEAKLIEDVEIIGVRNIEDVINYFENEERYLNTLNSLQRVNKKKTKYKIDFSDIKGQDYLKTTAAIAVAGMHNCLLVGPPGSGKSMWAKRLPTIQPPLTQDESIELSKLYSIKGLLQSNDPLITTRPFRSPHHTMSAVSLIGGGSIPMPGEISLANYGVLFLDELPEFPRTVIEALRQPLEDKTITIARARNASTYPANFQLVAAMNPCPCGYYPDTNKCTCTENQINRYLGKISGPFIDRIDICVSVMPVTLESLVAIKNEKEVSSADLKELVMIGRRRQELRYKNESINYNSLLSPKLIEKYCRLNDECQEFISYGYDKYNLTARSYHKILRVARTIADISDRDEINISDLRKAFSYRDLSSIRT